MDTIAAAATGAGTAALAVIRLSGPAAVRIADELFRPASGGVFSACPARYAVFGTVAAPGGPVLDACLALRFPAPHSYTGEDCVEIQCHGGRLLVDRILRLCYAAGARAAQPGEFTKRALLHNKLTLPQAEAVADLIHAETAEGAQNAAAQLTGPFSQTMTTLHDALIALAAHFTAYIDYTEEGVEPPDFAAVRAELADIARVLRKLADSFATGRRFTEGVACVLLGRPNAGKSSLFNALAQEDRAIVTGVPGTTRDTLEASAVVGGVLLRLIDTAGLRESGDAVERLGVERARKAAKAAGLLLAVFDQSAPPTKEDRAVLAAAQGETPVLYIKNKADLPENAEMAAFLSDKNAIYLSAKTSAGLDRLAGAVQALFFEGKLPEDGSIITNRRQADALRRAGEAAQKAADALAQGFTPDVAWIDVEQALAALSEVTGRAVSEDVFTQVFARFCVGK